METEQQLFKFKQSKKKNKKQDVKQKKKVNNTKQIFNKVYNLNNNGKIKKKKVKKIRTPKENGDGSVKEPYNIDQLEEKIQKIKEIEEPNKKNRKKLRQLEHLHKKITQHLLTEKSLGIESDKAKLTSVADDKSEEDSDMDEDKMEVSADKKQDADDSSDDDETETGVKRFVLFVGNLPKDTKENEIRQHFAKVGAIKSIRIPESKESRKNGFAFIELDDRITYEKTLSMHHTMLNSKRINVLYTMPDGRTFDKKEIMRKNAKLDALRKAGKLAGSVAEHKKRSFRRKKKRLAEAKASSSLK